MCLDIFSRIYCKGSESRGKSSLLSLGLMQLKVQCITQDVVEKQVVKL